MRTVEQLRDKLKSDIKRLQAKCKHRYYEWMEEFWAPGHSSGMEVKVCLRCEKKLESKTRGVYDK